MVLFAILTTLVPPTLLQNYIAPVFFIKTEQK